MGYAVKMVGYPPNTQVYGKGGVDCPACDNPDVGTWMAAALKSDHPGGIHVVMADGSVTFLGNAIEIEAFKDLADRADHHPPRGL